MGGAGRFGIMVSMIGTWIRIRASGNSRCIEWMGVICKIVQVLSLQDGVKGSRNTFTYQETRYRHNLIGARYLGAVKVSWVGS